MGKAVLSRLDFMRLAVATAAGAMLSACQPEVAQETAEVEEAAGEPVEVPPVEEAITLRHLTRGGTYLDDVAQRQIDVFTAEHPNITIELDKTPTGDLLDKLLLQVAAGNAPDSWFGDPRSGGLAWHKNMLVDLDPYLDSEPTYNEEDFIENAWVGAEFGGKIHGLAWDSGALMVQFNIDMFEEAGVDVPEPDTPLTWSQLIDIGTQLTLDFDDRHPDSTEFDPSRVKQYGFGFRDRFFFPFLWTNLAEFIESDGSMPIDTPEAIEAMQFAADIGAKHFIGPSPGYQQSMEISLVMKTLAMHYNGVWMLGRLNEAELNWGAIPFPVSKVPASYGHYSPLMLTRDSKHIDEAFKFIYWACCSKEGQGILLETGMLQPTRRDLIDEFVNSADPPARKYRQAFVDAFDPASFRYPGDTMGSFAGGFLGLIVDDTILPAMDPVWRGDVAYEEIASDLREKCEYALEHGELM